MNNYDLRKLDIAQVLMLLFNAAHSTTMPESRKYEEDIDLAEAKIQLLKMKMGGTFYIRHLKGRLLDLDFSGDFLDTTRYDIANGTGKSAAALKSIFGEKTDGAQP